MRIVKSNSDELVLSGGFFTQAIWGFIFILAALIAAYFLGRTVDVRCKRAGANMAACTLNEQIAGLATVNQRNINGVRAAKIEDYHGRKRAHTYKVFLLTTSGPVPLTNHASSGYDEKASIANRLNNFIRSSEPDVLEFRVSAGWGIRIFVILFAVCGLAMLLSAKTARIEMIRSKGMFAVQRSGIFGRRRQELLLQEIKEAQLQFSQNRRGSGTAYRMAIIKKSGEEILPSSAYTAGSSGKKLAVDAMNTFLSRVPAGR